MNIDPLVSVVMTAYNSERYIYQTLKSILNQKYKKIEVIIVLEYGITDNTEKIVKRVCRSDKRIRVINNNKRLGIAESRNVGLRNASGKYVTIIDSDDIMLHNRISVQVRYMEKNADVILCGADVFHIDDEGKIIGYNHTLQSPDDIKMGMLKIYPITSPTIFFRRKVMEDNDWYQPTDEHSEDMAWLRKFVYGGKVCNIPIPLACYRLSKTSATRASKRNMAVESLYRIRSEICSSKNIDFSDNVLGCGLRLKTEKRLQKSEKFVRECIDKGLIHNDCDEFNYRLYRDFGKNAYISAYRMWKNIYNKKKSLISILYRCCNYAIYSRFLIHFESVFYKKEINEYVIKKG